MSFQLKPRHHHQNHRAVQIHREVQIHQEVRMAFVQIILTGLIEVIQQATYTLIIMNNDINFRIEFVFTVIYINYHIYTYQLSMQSVTSL